MGSERLKHHMQKDLKKNNVTSRFIVCLIDAIINHDVASPPAVLKQNPFGFGSNSQILQPLA